MGIKISCDKCGWDISGESIYCKDCYANLQDKIIELEDEIERLNGKQEV